MKYRLIVTDLDDTLLHEDLTISDRSMRAIANAREKGIHVALATGRMFPSAAPYARKLGLSGPILCCQGAEIADIETGKPLKIIGVPLNLARDVLRFAQHEGIYAQFYSLENYFFEKECEESQYYKRLSGIEGRPLGKKLAEVLDFEPIKVLFISDPQRIRQVYEDARARFGDRLSVTISKSRYLEFTHPLANKGGAVQELAQMLGIPREQVMAVGDALNDLPMLEFAGLGVAMANGDETVKARAGAVTASNEEDGVAQAIEQYALGE